MNKILAFGAIVVGAIVIDAVTFGAGVGLAAEGVDAPAEMAQDASAPLTTGRSLANAPYLTKSGGTVPHPGLSGDAPSGGGRQIHDRDDRILRRGICSNC
ncbi:hypothetical protein [Methylocapsa acidiphila]|uniref:hypothetical protein n=1 Tax=Methylocapsa acidiphila TaxID=133552 RepID=UPI000417CA15|nr:hypothetical protein [Methylocapsa acidiphila]